MSHRIGDDDVIYNNKWRDQLGNSSIARNSGIIEEAYRDTGHIMQFIRHNLDGEIFFEYQFNHMYDLDSTIGFHVHLIPMASSSGNIYLTWDYFFAPAETAIPALAGWTSGSLVYPLTAADQYKHKYFSIFYFTPSGASLSSILLVNFRRESTDVLDTYDGNKDHGTLAANLGIKWIDCHYQTIRAGSSMEFAI